MPEDDGSLSFLKIEPDPENRSFNCKQISQTDLINKSFWVIDFIPNLKTKHGENRYLVKINEEKDAPDTDARKFFTNSRDIKYVLDKIKERDAFPRKVSMRAQGTKYWLE